jgi:O-antigen ligase
MTSTALVRAPGDVPVLPPSLRAALLSPLSFEAVVTLYMFAGMYKGDPRFAWIPVDPTVLFFALSILIGTLILVSKPLFRPGLPAVVAGLALVTWFAISLLWSPSQIYGPDKVFFMATLALWGLIAGAMIIAPDRTRLRRLFAVLVLASLVAALEAIAVYLEAGGGRLWVGSGNYLLLGRLCGLGAEVVFVAWLFMRRRFALYGLVCLGLFGLFGFVLIIGGGRGPLIATVASLLLTLVAGVRTSRHGLRLAAYEAPAIALGLFALGALTVWITSSEQMPETLSRLEPLAEGAGLDSSAQSRVDHYETALGLWNDAPVLGHGAGSWPLLVGRPDAVGYPHNIFAEAAVEGGVIGLVLLAGLLMIALRPVSFAKVRRDPLSMCVLMLFINGFVNAMVSGDLPGNRVLFLLIGTLSALALPQPAQPSRRRRRRSLDSPASSPSGSNPGTRSRLRWPAASP